MLDLINVSYDTQIPNNVGLSEDRKVLKALEKWHPGYIDWWNKLIPQDFQESMVYLRTAVSVDPKGWAKFDYVKMPEYRWGVLLAPQAEDRVIPMGEHKGEKAWQEVPGEYRNMLKRLIVIQGDTEPGSVEQQMIYWCGPRVPMMRHVCWGRSTKKRRIGCLSSCSPTLPTVTARCSLNRWRNRASTRLVGPAALC